MPCIRSKFSPIGLLVAVFAVASPWVGSSVVGQQPPRSEARQQDGGGALDDFRPQTDRERALLQLIQQLQREVAALRREVQAARGEGRSDDRQVDRGESDLSRLTDDQIAKHQKTFQTYDKNGDNRVSFEERLAMKNFAVTGERLLNEKLYHLSEDMNRDGVISLPEFAAARTRKQSSSWMRAQLLRVDAEDFVVTVEAPGGERGSALGARMISVEPKAVIAVRGAEASLGELRTGQPIFLFMSHDNKAVIGLTQR